MTDRNASSADAPETHNDEQDDESSQAQTIADEARNRDGEASPLDSIRVHGGIAGEDDEQDLIDHMRDMEQSGRIDMNAYRGEPNDDDDEDMYGEGHDDDE